MNHQAQSTAMPGSNAATIGNESYLTRSTSDERKEIQEVALNRDQMVLCRAYFQHLRKMLMDGRSTIQDFKLIQPLDNLAVMASEDTNPADEARLNAKKRLVTLHVKEQAYWNEFHRNKCGPFSGKTLSDLWMQVDSVMSSPWMKGIQVRDVLSHDDSKLFEVMHEMYSGALISVVILLGKLDSALADDSHRTLSIETPLPNASATPSYAAAAWQSGPKVEPREEVRHSWPEITFDEPETMEEGQLTAQGTGRKRAYFARLLKCIKKTP